MKSRFVMWFVLLILNLIFFPSIFLYDIKIQRILIDYELLGFVETGLDLIEKLNLRDQAILVTSRYEESKIREKAKDMGIKIIPKSFAPYIPITIENGEKTSNQS